MSRDGRTRHGSEAAVMTATSLGDLSAQIRLLLTNKGISSIEAIGVLESVKFSLLADAWDIANENAQKEE